MIDKRIQELVRYRMEQAKETLREAELLLEAEAPRGCINRAYYAMFYAVLALLASRQLGTSKHSGAIALFDREFVKSQVFSPSLSRSLHLAFDLRQSQDYGEATPPDTLTAVQTVDEARTFITAVEGHLTGAGLL